MAGKKLLVADDSLTIQKVIRLALSNEGYEIQAISDGAEAIQQIATFRPDAVLIDVSLPTRSAFDIKREVNGMPDHAATRFVLMSSAFEKIDEAQAEEVGFDGQLTKPFDPAHLRQILSEVLAAPPPPPAASPPPAVELAPPTAEPSPIKIQFEPPTDLPPSDFEVVESSLAKEPAGPVPVSPVIDPPEAESSNDDIELWGKHEETPPPAAPMSAAPQTSGRDEIRELTESTIRMSGLADLPQTPASDFDWSVNEPSLKPPSSLADVGESGFGTDSPPPSSTPPPPPTDMPGLSSMAEMPGLEDAVRRQIQETLEKMAREILPAVAERVIKAEINKLLNEKL